MSEVGSEWRVCPTCAGSFVCGAASTRLYCGDACRAAYNRDDRPDRKLERWRVVPDFRPHRVTATDIALLRLRVHA